MNYEYLNFLFSEKFNAESVVKTINADEGNPLPAESADFIIKERNARKAFWMSNVASLENSIKKYLALHPVKP